MKCRCFFLRQKEKLKDDEYDQPSCHEIQTKSEMNRVMSTINRHVEVKGKIKVGHNQICPVNTIFSSMRSLEQETGQQRQVPQQFHYQLCVCVATKGGRHRAPSGSD